MAPPTAAPQRKAAADLACSDRRRHPWLTLGQMPTSLQAEAHVSLRHRMCLTITAGMQSWTALQSLAECRGCRTHRRIAALLRGALRLRVGNTSGFYQKASTVKK